jgi:hypothetical protein
MLWTAPEGAVHRLCGSAVKGNVSQGKIKGIDCVDRYRSSPASTEVFRFNLSMSFQAGSLFKLSLREEATASCAA